MPAQNSRVLEKKQLYYHIFRENKQNIIFIDSEDYQVFLNFLKNYFSNSNNLENDKKTFTIKGRTYRGIPHKPQNFVNQIELLAYKLEPNRFDLLIKQITQGALEKFIRAL